MKTLETDKLETLLSIIQKRPGQRICHFSEGSHTLTKALSALCSEIESSYQLNCTKESFYDKCVTKYGDAAHMHISKFNLARPRYAIQGKEYDYLLVTVTLEGEARREFLEKCYPMIKTGGNIIIFIPKGGYEQRDYWRSVLEEQYYVSTSIIDDLFEHYDVIVSKRMHGWGDK